MADLDAASLDDVKQWFRDYYGAANTTIVLAGDITPAALTQLINRDSPLVVDLSSMAATKPVTTSRTTVR